MTMGKPAPSSVLADTFSPSGEKGPDNSLTPTVTGLVKPFALQAGILISFTGADGFSGQFRLT